MEKWERKSKNLKIHSVDVNGMYRAVLGKLRVGPLGESSSPYQVDKETGCNLAKEATMGDK